MPLRSMRRSASFPIFWRLFLLQSNRAVLGTNPKERQAEMKIRVGTSTQAGSFCKEKFLSFTRCALEYFGMLYFCMLMHYTIFRVESQHLWCL